MDGCRPDGSFILTRRDDAPLMGDEALAARRLARLVVEHLATALDSDAKYPPWQAEMVREARKVLGE